MSLYNMLLGTDPYAPVVIGLLGFAPTDIPRLRDAYINMDDPKEPTLVIYTRTGGGNRSGYLAENDKMQAWPGYIRDYDDEFDSTYAHFEYKIPDEHRHVVLELIDKGIANGFPFKKPMDRFKDAMDAVKQQTPPTT